MSLPKIKAHCSYIGTTGYNHHSRDFFKKLSEKVDLKVRNYTIGKSWKGNNDEPHNGEPYLDTLDKKLLVEQTLSNRDGTRSEFPIYTNYQNQFEQDIDLVLVETPHHYFFDSYNKPKIAYNVWESTLQPPYFFNKLLEFDQIWVPSQWQADCTIKQGAHPNTVKVVPEGVDVNTFYPEDPQTTLDYVDGRFKFTLFGRWDYRKSTKEIIETFLKEFKPSEPVDLIVSIDNPYSGDSHGTTEKRLKHYGFTDKRIKIKHFPSREDYVTYLKNGHVFLSCARSEGWNLPLIEAMACGTPSIYSACSGQMEFAKGKGLPVKILGEKPVMDADYNHFNSSVGNYYEPDYKDLARVMRDAFENYIDHKKRAIEEAKLIHRDFNWDKVAEIGLNTLKEFKPKNQNNILISYTDGIKCEVKGSLSKKYHVKFYNDITNELIHEGVITNNMWTAPNYKSFVKWRIEVWVSGKKEFNHVLDLKDKKVYIALESKSIGDTIAWFPYVEEFRKKHNCKIICSTFHNNWFKSKYPNIEFVNPGDLVSYNVFYKIGWFYKDYYPDSSYHPLNIKTQPLQKTASDILGLKYKEIIPKFKSLNPSSIKEKYVTIAMQSTSQCKYWNYPKGWEQIVNYLQNKGYKVAAVDQHRNFGIANFMNRSPQCDYHFHNKPLDEVMSIIEGAEFHIGISSGLSWLAWTLNIPTILISSFTHPDHCEFKSNVTRIYNDMPPSGYFSTHKMDASDWNWYPFQKIKSMEDWFKIETITPDLVIEGIDRIL